MTSAVLAAVTLLSGCGRVLGPERVETTTARGRVTLNGRPITEGWLEFTPIDGTLGRIRSAPVASDGSFEATRIPIGRIGIRLAGRPLSSTGNPGLDRFLFNLHRAPLIRETIRAGAVARLDIELRDEMNRFARENPAP